MYRLNRRILSSSLLQLFPRLFHINRRQFLFGSEFHFTLSTCESWTFCLLNSDYGTRKLSHDSRNCKRPSPNGENHIQSRWDWDSVYGRSDWRWGRWRLTAGRPTKQPSRFSYKDLTIRTDFEMMKVSLAAGKIEEVCQKLVNKTIWRFQRFRNIIFDLLPKLSSLLV